MKLRTTLLAAAAMVTMATAANAAAITGNFSISGPVTVNNPGVTVDQATSLSFPIVTNYNPAVGSGVLGTLPACFSSCGTGVTLNLMSMVSPYTFGVSPSNPLFTLSNGLSFDLTTITDEARVSAANNGGLALLRISGTILLHLAGYSDTVGTFTIQSNGAVGSATFAASGIAAATPEPASLAILGGSLAVLGLARRRRRAK